MVIELEDRLVVCQVCRGAELMPTYTTGPDNTEFYDLGMQPCGWCGGSGYQDVEEVEVVR